MWQHILLPFSCALGHAGLMEDAHPGGRVRGHVVGPDFHQELQHPTPPAGGGDRGNGGYRAWAGSRSRAKIMGARWRSEIWCSSSPEPAAKQHQQQWRRRSHDQEARGAAPQVNQRHIHAVPQFLSWGNRCLVIKNTYKKKKIPYYSESRLNQLRQTWSFNTCCKRLHRVTAGMLVYHIERQIAFHTQLQTIQSPAGPTCWPQKKHNSMRGYIDV